MSGRRGDGRRTEKRKGIRVTPFQLLLPLAVVSSTFRLRSIPLSPSTSPSPDQHEHLKLGFLASHPSISPLKQSHHVTLMIPLTSPFRRTCKHMQSA